MNNSVCVGIQWMGLRRGNWCDPFQLFDHGSIANITGVENVIDAFKMSSNC